MSLIKNVRTLLTSPATMKDYVLYHASKLSRGRAEKCLHGVRLSSFINFSEFHTCNAVSHEERRFLESYEFGEGVILDVGANLGLVSLILAKKFPDRTIYPFEPNPSTFQALESNLKLNGINDVRCFELAISEHNGQAQFNADPRSRATNKITKEKDEHHVSVPCRTLDSFLEQYKIEKVALLKVDVEGHEQGIFEGAR